MNESIWLKELIPNYPSLKGSRKFDVVVIGGGIAGLSAAYFLKKAGKKSQFWKDAESVAPRRVRPRPTLRRSLI